MSSEKREGYFKDKYGRWHEDRRTDGDRRDGAADGHDHDRRKMFRRQADREMLKSTQQEINDALNDFAEEHDGHL